jgi:sulfide:quinone oxidoreductase
MSDSYRVVVVGGGTAGLTVAAQLRALPDPPEVGIIEPSEQHFYQPLWTLVGGGVFPKESSVRAEADYIPPGATWIRDSVASFDPEGKTVTTDSGKTIGYEYLVVCPGIQLDWNKIPGLAETIGKNGVCSNYGYEQSEYTWEVLGKLKGGAALFTQPATPVKCGGAPQKIMYLTADHLRRTGALEDSEIHFFSPGTVVFGVPEFERTLKKVQQRYGIDFHLRHELVEIDGEARQATVQVRNENEEIVDRRTYGFDMIHVVPPQSAPDFVKQSPLANAEGWIDVDQYTLQHSRYPDIFSLGDASSAPNAKTGAAVRKQAPVVVHNLRQLMEEGRISRPKLYDGYSSCPLITGYGKLVLAEFDFDNRPLPSFPFDTTQERYSMYAMKTYVLPEFYWNGMLRGRG